MPNAGGKDQEGETPVRVLEIVHEGKFRIDAVSVLIAHMVFPDNDRSREQVVAVMRLEAKHRRVEPKAEQGDIMRATEKELCKHKTLGRMAGDVALKMIDECGRDGNASLEFATTFVSDYYTSEQTPSEKYPTDTRRLQKEVRCLKNSLHYWAAWQICQDVADFDFVRSTENLEQLLFTAGLVQFAMQTVPYFSDWNPWMVPVEFTQQIESDGSTLPVPRETEFERAFAKEYKNKIGRLG